MKPHPCFETNQLLEAAARRAERRKCQAIARLVRKLGSAHRFDPPHSHAPVSDAEKYALKEKEQ
jgi:hypothetical protein